MLGLFHGLPTWYRKHQADLQAMQCDDRPLSLTRPYPLGGGAVGYGSGSGPRIGNPGGAFGTGAAARAQNWRRIEAAPSPAPAAAPPVRTDEDFPPLSATVSRTNSTSDTRDDTYGGAARGSARVGK